jgi:hypothetical protein
MPGKQLKKPQLLSLVQNKPTPPSTLPKKHKSISVHLQILDAGTTKHKKHKSISVHLQILDAGTTKHRTAHPEQLALLKVKQ